MFRKAWSRSFLYRMFFGVEEWLKGRVFGCHSCGQCVVRSLALRCPMQCPKQLRNGPCGGSMDGMCEVYPGRECVWTGIYSRSERLGWLRKLQKVQPAVDWSLWGTSAVLNIFERKIDHNGGVLSPHPTPCPKPAEIEQGIADRAGDNA